MAFPGVPDDQYASKSDSPTWGKAFTIVGQEHVNKVSPVLQLYRSVRLEWTRTNKCLDNKRKVPMARVMNLKVGVDILSKVLTQCREYVQQQLARETEEAADDTMTLAKSMMESNRLIKELTKTNTKRLETVMQKQESIKRKVKKVVDAE
jgi:hypothetical protein